MHSSLQRRSTPRRAEGEPLAEADWAIGSARGNYFTAALPSVTGGSEAPQLIEVYRSPAFGRGGR